MRYLHCLLLSLQTQSSIHSTRHTKPSGNSSNNNGKGSSVKRLVQIGTFKAFFRGNHTTSSSYNSSSTPFPAAGAADSRPLTASGAADSRPVTAPASNSNTLNIQAPRISSTHAPDLRSSYSSSSKGPPAPVTLFGNNQARAGPPQGPSVARFCAPSGGGCSLLTPTGA